MNDNDKPATKPRREPRQSHRHQPRQPMPALVTPHEAPAWLTVETAEALLGVSVWRDD